MKDVPAGGHASHVRRAPSGRCHLRLVVPPPPALPCPFATPDLSSSPALFSLKQVC